MKKFIISMFMIVSIFITNSLGASAVTFEFEDCVKIGNKIYVNQNQIEKKDEIKEFIKSVKTFYKYLYNSPLDLNIENLDKLIFLTSKEGYFNLCISYDDDLIKSFDNDNLYLRKKDENYSIVINVDEINDVNIKLYVVKAIRSIVIKDFVNA